MEAQDIEAKIQFFSEDVDFELEESSLYEQWLTQVATDGGYDIEAINYIFCSDEYLHDINVSYLDHDTYTDIITFDNSEEGGLIESDIFISIERVQENAEGFQVSFEAELKRVMVHGILHLIGYKDKSPEEAQEMRKQENRWVEAFPKI